MGRVSSRALDEGGKVHGIIPAAFLSAEAPDRANSTRPNERETVVGSMHERKKLSEYLPTRLATRECARLSSSSQWPTCRTRSLVYPAGTAHLKRLRR